MPAPQRWLATDKILFTPGDEAFAPQVLGLRSGGFTVAVTTGDGNPFVAVSKVDGDGSSYQSGSASNVTEAAFEGAPHAVQLDDGRFASVYTSQPASTSDPNGKDVWVRLTLPDPDGQDSAVHREFLVASGVDHQIQPVVAGDISGQFVSNGNFAVAWLDLAGSNSIQFREYNEVGNLRESLTISLAPYALSTSIDYDSISLVGVASGGYMLGYSDSSLGGHIALIRGDTVVDIPIPGSGTELWPQLSDLPDGRVAAVYFGNEGAKFMVLNGDGSIAIAPTTLGDTSVSFDSAPAGTALQDGRMMFVWKAQNGELFGRIYSAAGVADGAFFAVNQVTTGIQGNLSIDTLADGRVAVAWESDETGAPQIKFTIFDPREKGQLLLGTTDNDDFVGTRFNDTIYMGVGHDQVDGGAGNDRLEGGLGNDTLKGGLGIDTLVGGFGNDIYEVDNARDVIIEENGQGYDKVIALTGFTLKSGVSVEEIELRTSSQNVRVTGNEFDQLILGNFRNNVLDGGGGTDTLSGGNGSDKYYVDSFGDVVIEAEGQGTADSIYTSVSYSLAAGAEVERVYADPRADVAPINLVGNEYDQTLQGNAGANRLTGKGGADILVGLAGNDTFIFGGLGDMGVGSLRDTIQDFEDRGDDDTIHLGGFAGTLTFIGDSAFTGLNQVRAIQSGSHVLIQINATGDTAVDAEIRLVNTTLSQVTASDFVL
jgi:Ca2+-binding RTX toxin-like protein